MTNLQYRIYKNYVKLMFVAVILSVPLAFVLPVECSFENGLIENAQVVILILATIWILNVRSRIKWFQRFCAAGFVLMALRELSWGRVFFPIGMDQFGAVFVPMVDYKYRVPVYILTAAYITAMLVMLIRFVPVRKILFGRQPLGAFAVISIALILNHVGDHGYFFCKGNGQILEEFNELIFYMTLPSVALYWLWQKKNPSG